MLCKLSASAISVADGLHGIAGLAEVCGLARAGLLQVSVARLQEGLASLVQFASLLHSPHW